MLLPLHALSEELSRHESDRRKERLEDRRLERGEWRASEDDEEVCRGNAGEHAEAGREEGDKEA